MSYATGWVILGGIIAVTTLALGLMAAWERLPACERARRRYYADAWLLWAREWALTPPAAAEECARIRARFVLAALSCRCCCCATAAEVRDDGYGEWNT